VCRRSSSSRPLRCHVAPFEAGAYARTVQIRPSRPAGAAPDVAAVGASAPTLAPSSAARQATLADADPELLKLFIEEAHEELTRIQHCFPAWDHNPLERDSLVTVRRSFHTLKGSGRMVGARELAEFRVGDREPAQPRPRQHPEPFPADTRDLRAAVGALPS